MDCYEIIDWNEEAKAIIRDVKQFVNMIDLSKINNEPDNYNNRQQIYINLETKEGNQFTLCLSASGLRICASTFDLDEEQSRSGGISNNDEDSTEIEAEIYETIYALLTNKSPAYRQAFASALANKIVAISDNKQI